MTDAVAETTAEARLNNIRRVRPGLVRGTCSECGLIAEIETTTKKVFHTEPFCSAVIGWQAKTGLPLLVYAPANRREKRINEALMRAKVTKGVRR